MVTFHFLPGKSAEAMRILQEEALPLYRLDRPLLRFRAYREVESPEPLDLVVVSSFEGLAGMDESNRALADEAQKNGTSVRALYERIGDLTQSHRDELAELDPSLAWGEVDEAKLQVWISIRPVPGGLDGYRTLLRDELVPWERKSETITGSETGIYLLSSGYRILRVVGIDDLDAWHRYQSESRKTTSFRKADQLTAEEREIVLAPQRELAVR